MSDAQDELRYLSFVGVEPPHRQHRSARPHRSAQECPIDAEAAGPDGFSRWLLTRAGLDPAAYRARPLERRISACLRAIRVPSTEQAQMLLERKSELLPAAISALLLGVSEFFRDAGVFQTLERTILPQLALHRKDLRIWSAACSDGQEVYSVAILLAELGLLNSSHLLGSDCRVDAIDRAKKGIYDEHAMHQVKDPFRQRYFLRQGSGHFVSPELRERTSWKRCDLAAEIEPGPWDMILFRNVAIYLNADSARAIWNRLAEALAIGGVLVVGKAERPDCQVPLERVDHCVYRRTGG